MTANQPSATSETRPRGRLQAALVALTFLGSLGIAFFLYYGLEWVPGADAAHGELIHPAHSLEAFRGTRLDGGDYGLKDLEGQWNMVFVHTGRCGDACQESMYRLRQVRLTFGKDMERLNRVMFIEEGTDAHGIREVIEAHPDLSVVRAEGDLLSQLRHGVGQEVENTVLLVDPLGNLMMRYPIDFELKGLQGDLKRLLKYSHIG